MFCIAARLNWQGGRVPSTACRELEFNKYDTSGSARFPLTSCAALKNARAARTYE